MCARQGSHLFVADLANPMDCQRYQLVVQLCQAVLGQSTVENNEVGWSCVACKVLLQCL
jgi:hypothetical protein